MNNSEQQDDIGIGDVVVGIAYASLLIGLIMWIA